MTMRILRSLAFLAGTALIAAACGGGAAPAAQASPAKATAAAAVTATPTPAPYPTKALTIMAPAGPGGGFDTTARLLAKALSDEKLVSVPISVTNKPGAGGTVGMAEVIKDTGNAHSLIVIGRVTLGSQITGKTAAKVAQMTPVARLMAEAEVLVTPANSPFKTVKDLMDALKKDAKAVKFAGGSAGGIDHELAAQLVKAATGSIAGLAYVPFAGGGEAAAAIIGGQVQVGISGFGEFKGQIDSGQMKALAVSADKPLATASKIPTLKGEGVDIVIVNWRLLGAPPNISATELATLKDLVKKATASKTWKDFATKNDWFDNFTTDGLPAFLAAEEKSLTATLTELGLVK